MDLSLREGHGAAIVSLILCLFYTNASAVVLLLLLLLTAQVHNPHPGVPPVQYILVFSMLYPLQLRKGWFIIS